MSQTTVADFPANAAPSAGVKVLMLDVDGVLVRGRPQDGLPFTTGLETDVGLSPATLQAEFFAPHWQDIVTGRASLLERLSPVLARIAPQVAAEALVAYWFENDSRIDHDILAAVAACREMGVRTYLATNQEHQRASYLMTTMGLGAHVDGIIYSAELGHRKPTPEFYRIAAGRADVAPAEIVLIDDTPANVEAARRCGWHAVHWTGDDGLHEALAPYLGVD